MTQKQFNNVLDVTSIPPSDIDSEKSLLAALMIDPYREGVLSVIVNILTFESFFYNRHAIIYQAIMSLYDRNIEIDLITIAHELRKVNKLDEIGSEIYLTELTDCAMNSIHAVRHAMIIQELYISREIIHLCSDVQKKAFSKNMDIDELIKMFEKRIKALEEKAKHSLPNRKTNLVKSVIAKIIEIKDTGVNNDIIKTGNYQLDKILTLMPNEIIFIAGPPKSTKTTTMIFGVHSMIKLNQDKVNILWYCMEDAVEDVTKCRLSIECGVSRKSMDGTSGYLTSDQIALIKQSEPVLDNDFIELVDRPSDVETIARHFKTFVKKNTTNILIIDNYNMCVARVNHLKTPTEKESYVADQIQSVMSYLKSEGYKCICIVIDHLNKELQDKANIKDGYRPRTSNLKGSERKHAILTQLVLVNKPGEYPDLVSEEAKAPDVKINGKYHKRKDLLNSDDGWGLIILEKTTARKTGRTIENKFARFYSHIDTMRYINFNEI